VQIVLRINFIYFLLDVTPFDRFIAMQEHHLQDRVRDGTKPILRLLGL